MSEQNEQLIPLTAMTGMLPVPVSRQSLHRWVTHGLNGQKLEVEKLGRRRFVKPSKARAFIDAITK